MDFIDRLKGLQDRVEKLKEKVHTEEATKNAFIMPFLSALGYDVFDPTEVVPEFIADMGIKKGEKVDYCIKKDDVPIIIIECKHWKENLSLHKSQLHRYFHAVKARFAILTNGLSYLFYSDLDEKNKMDTKPFFEFHIEDLTERAANELKRFQKNVFDVESILSTASDLKYSKHIRELLSEDLSNPSDDFVKYVASKVYSGRVTSKIQELFKKLTKGAVTQLVEGMINDRLRKALSSGTPEVPSTETEGENSGEKEEEPKGNGVETTEEELQGFRIIQAILMPHLDSEQIAHRDTKSYFGVLFEDNRRKPICRLWLNRSKKYLEVFDENKNGEKFEIEKIEDLYSHKEKIIESAIRYLPKETEG